MARFDWRNPSRGLTITVIAVAAICLGFLADLIITCFEKNAYPQDYAEYVTVYAEKYGVPEELVYAVIRTESDFDSGAVSSAGAVGLMQLMPQTFKWLTDEILFEHMESGMIYDPETNIRYGTYYLSRLYDRYGNWEVALAAYNGGPGNVDKWLENDRYADGEGGLKRIPFRETRHFVARVTDAREMYERLYEKDFTAKTATPAK
jgi:soluble lytic murein transglycosylase